MGTRVPSIKLTSPSQSSQEQLSSVEPANEEHEPDEMPQLLITPTTARKERARKLSVLSLNSVESYELKPINGPSDKKAEVSKPYPTPLRYIFGSSKGNPN